MGSRSTTNLRGDDEEQRAWILALQDLFRELVWEFFIWLLPDQRDHPDALFYFHRS
jgi:hypothetical protein